MQSKSTLLSFDTNRYEILSIKFVCKWVEFYWWKSIFDLVEITKK